MFSEKNRKRNNELKLLFQRLNTVWRMTLVSDVMTYCLGLYTTYKKILLFEMVRLVSDNVLLRTYKRKLCCFRCDVVHLASDDVLLRTYEFCRESKEDQVHYYYGPNIAKMRVIDRSIVN